MTVDTKQAYEEWAGPDMTGSTAEEAHIADEPIGDVVERVNQILGYDIFAAHTLMEGYRELAEESAAMAESNLAAAAEVLPEE